MEKSKNIYKIHGFVDMMGKSLPLSLNYFIDLFPFTITLIVFKYLDNSLLQEIIGLSITYLSFGFNHLIGIQDAIGIKCSKEFAKKNHKRFWAKYFLIFFIDLCLLTMPVFFIIYSSKILHMVKIDNELIIKLSPLLNQLLVAKLLENVNNMIKGILVAQNFSNIFIRTNLINFITFTVVLLSTVVFFHLDLIGFVIAFYCKIFADFFMLLIILYKYNKVPFFLPEVAFIFVNFFKDLKFTIYILIGLYGEWIGMEVITYLATLSHKIENINAWYFYLNVVIYCYYLLVGIVSVFRIYCSFAIGQKNIREYEKVSKQIFLYGFIMISSLSILICIFARNIAAIFTTHEETLNITTSILHLSIITNTIDFVYCSYSALLRIIGYEDLQFFIGAFQFPIFIIFFSYIFGIYFKLENQGLIFGYITGQIFITATVVYFYNKNKKYFFIIY